MTKKGKFNSELKEKFAQLKLSPLTFQSGGIYKTKDGNVLFPTRKSIKDEDKPRMVVVMGTPEQLNDPLLPHVLAIPITTKFELETDQDLRTPAGDGNLDDDSLLKAGMIQPILKSHFERQIGVLPKPQFELLQASVSFNLGLLDDDEDDATEETLKND